MDTPLIKAVWTAEVRVSVNISNVFMSALSIGKRQDGDLNVYTFT